MFRYTALSSVTGVIAFATASVADAETFTASTTLGPSHKLTEVAYLEFAEYMKEKTSGAIGFEVFAANALVPARSQMQAAADGVAQVTQFGASYTPADLPVSNALMEMALVSSDVLLVALAYTEMNLKNEQLQEEWRTNGVVFGGGYASVPYRMLCRSEANTLDQIEGLRVRMPGGIWDRWAAAVGMVPVNVPSTEMFMGLERGTLDCAVNGADALQSFALWDAVKYVNTIELGTYYSPLWAYNRDFWTNVGLEGREALVDAMATFLVRTHLEYVEMADMVLKEADERGIIVQEPSKELSSAVVDFASELQSSLIESASATLGAEKAQALVDDFRSYIDRWNNLLEGVDRSDEEALIKLVKEEVYGDVDLNSYGLSK